jgi:predicted Rossmann fold nucleotide-binding protein DprA/Smf involved in DNA uptake
MNEILTEDTKVICMLCAPFGNTKEKTLTPGEYTRLAIWLRDSKYRPKDLYDSEIINSLPQSVKIEKERLKSLMERGVQLGFAIEEWQRNGIWVLSRSDSDYPQRYKRHHKEKSPPLLFGTGNKELLKTGGLAIVGSRNVDSQGEEFTKDIGKLCAKENIVVISGGARGVDQLSMNATLENGGYTVGVLAENLLKKSLEKTARHALNENRLLLISPYHPSARFTVGTAMGRNKLIYALADFGLIVSSDLKGGTWSGATEELKRDNAKPLFVRTGENIPKGNHKLLTMGAYEWPMTIKSDLFKTLTEISKMTKREIIPNNEPDLFSIKHEDTIKQDEIINNPGTKTNNEISIENSTEKEKESNNEKIKDNEIPGMPDQALYKAAIMIIKQQLVEPKTPEQIASKLDIPKTLANKWLKRAEEEKIVIKENRPVKYYLNKSPHQSTLL